MTDCVFCQLIQKKANMLFEDEKVFAMASPEPVVPGHVLVLPREHAPIFETVPDFVVGDMFKVANKVGVAIFESMGAQGTNMLLQNGSPAGQTHNHVILHVLPRFENDKLPLGWNPRPADDAELASLESKIKDETKNVGLFEKEKSKPVEMPKPAEVKEDYRTKWLRRVP